MNYRGESVNGIIFSRDRKEILLIKRRDVPVWVLPGGGIDLGEKPEDAALREVEEETGYKARLKRKVAEYTPLNRLARFTHFFECEIVSGSPALNSETQGVSFFPVEALPPLPPPYSDWIADAISDEKEMVRKSISSVTYLNLFRHLIMHPILVFRFLLARCGFPMNDR